MITVNLVKEVGTEGYVIIDGRIYLKGEGSLKVDSLPQETYTE